MTAPRRSARRLRLTGAAEGATILIGIPPRVRRDVRIVFAASRVRWHGREGLTCASYAVISDRQKRQRRTGPRKAPIRGESRIWAIEDAVTVHFRGTRCARAQIRWLTCWLTLAVRSDFLILDFLASTCGKLELARDVIGRQLRKGLRGARMESPYSLCELLVAPTRACRCRPIISVPLHDGFLELTPSPDPPCRTKESSHPDPRVPSKNFSGSSLQGLHESPTTRVQSLSEICSSRTINPTDPFYSFASEFSGQLVLAFSRRFCSVSG
ncbi:hypothetical protein GY45DRAFT_579412 [Cubamyces sp. BRFM 1775]|nr:hypothetical protein GY45DRAFT_579412 [Cubamyces sp. BRFM 1775]